MSYVDETGLAEVTTKLKAYVDSKAGGDLDIYIPLPSDFSTAIEVYYFKVNDNKYLVSADAQNIGIWLYNKTTNTMTQLGLTGISNNYNWKYFNEINRDVLISSDKSNTGIVLYDSSNDTLTRIYNNGYGYDLFANFENKTILGTSLVTSGNILLYNAINKTVTLLGTNKTASNFTVANNKCLCIMKNNTTPGIYVYNSLDDTFIQVDNTVYGYANNIAVGNKVILSGAGQFPIKFYDIATNTLIDQSTQTGQSSSYTRFLQINNEKVLIAGNNLLVANLTNNSIIQLQSGASWYLWNIIGIKVLVSRDTTTSGIGVYNSVDDSWQIIYSSGAKWQYVKQIGTNVLIGSSYSAGVLFYDGINNAVLKFSKGAYFDTFEDDTQHIDNCYITSTYITNRYKLYWDNTNQTLIPVGYNISK